MTCGEEGFEFGEEVRAGAPLKFSHATLVHHALASEFTHFCRNPVDGMYVTPSASDPFKWFGILFIRRGIFGGGIFRFSLNVPMNFPYTSDLPEVIFDNAIFHPLIELKTRKLDLSRSFPNGWKTERHDLLRVLVVVQRIFFFLRVQLRELQHKEKFREMAKEVVETSRAQVYDEPVDAEDLNCIRFTPWDASLHEPIREQMITIGGNSKASQRDNVSRNGLANATAAEFRRERDVRQRGPIAELVGKHFPRAYSWFDPESMTILTRKLREGETAASEGPGAGVSTARLDRERHGIEPLDLSGISSDTPKTSPVQRGSQIGEKGPDVTVDHLEKVNLSIEQQSEESVI
ncbi:unnamed protein product [Caenorhabditis auriculariae]|uniref:UBC core domain-containing protein n=1 Tax=Caenorhabditis auriculariae TaxID=2777116 RepID=A0A8S1GV29_9PELO|nr:unnamed protein product [Caenorhabditis auriculariae]